MAVCFVERFVKVVISIWRGTSLHPRGVDKQKKQCSLLVCVQTKMKISSTEDTKEENISLVSNRDTQSFITDLKAIVHGACTGPEHDFSPLRMAATPLSTPL